MKKNNSIDVKFLKLMQKGLPLIKRPFSSFTKYGITEKEAIKQIKKLKKESKLRSLNVKVPDFRKIYKGSALVAWQVPLLKISKVGSAFAKLPEITHCYQRPELPDFPYNLYTMIHTKTKAQLKKFVEKLSRKFKMKNPALKGEVSSQRGKIYSNVAFHPRPKGRGIQGDFLIKSYVILYTLKEYKKEKSYKF